MLPDRNAVTMTAPFMRAYTELLVRTCHQRGALAMGGMAAFIPSRRDPEVNAAALAKVRDDKTREAGDGFDGSWVAHPDLVPVCREVFDARARRPAQPARPAARRRQRSTAADLLDGGTTPGRGHRGRAAQQRRAWRCSTWRPGSAATARSAIYNLMEDAATAEISRSQVWQWVHNDVTLDDGPLVTRDLVQRIMGEELDKIRASAGAAFDAQRYDQAVALFTEVGLADTYAEFLTIPAYERMP